MSVTTSRGESFDEIYGEGQGRGDVEVHVIQTIGSYIIGYLADYEAERGLRLRTLPVPPTPESIHGGVDFLSFRGELFPEIIVIVQPVDEVERYDDGTYGGWFEVEVGAIVQVEGDQDQTRALADAYGTALQKLLPQQGEFGTNPDGSEFATRTRLQTPYEVAFMDNTVRDVLRATVAVRTFISNLVSDFEGPRTPPTNPYAVPLPWPMANQIEINLVRSLPNVSGTFTADAEIIDGTVNPPVTRFTQVTVTIPPSS